jgi:hypothetical protein
VDSDGDLDVVLADWGPENREYNEGGRTRLWLNDGAGHFTDATDDRMPDVLVKWSWELEFVDVDNDYDLDILVSCKMCTGSYLFENDGTGTFADKTEGNLPQFGNNYDFEAMDLNGDGYLDLTTINDGFGKRENLFLNNQQGGFEDATAQLWPEGENLGKDDGVVVFLDYESDGDADFLALEGPLYPVWGPDPGRLGRGAVAGGSTGGDHRADHLRGGLGSGLPAPPDDGGGPLCAGRLPRVAGDVSGLR